MFNNEGAGLCFYCEEYPPPVKDCEFCERRRETHRTIIRIEYDRYA